MADSILMANIKALRESKNWTQQEIADKLSISKSSISKWEKGDQIPAASYIQKYSEIFGCTVDDILKEEDLIFKLTNVKNVQPANENIIVQQPIIQQQIVEQPKVVNTEILYRGSVSYNNTFVKVKSESIWRMSGSQWTWFIIWFVICAGATLSVMLTDPELKDYDMTINVIASILVIAVFVLPLYAIFVIYRFITIKKVPIYTPNGDCEISNNGLIIISGGNKKLYEWGDVASFSSPEESKDKSIYYVKVKLKDSSDVIIAHTDLFEVIKPAKYFSIWKNSF